MVPPERLSRRRTAPSQPRARTQGIKEKDLAAAHTKHTPISPSLGGGGVTHPRHKPALPGGVPAGTSQSFPKPWPAPLGPPTPPLGGRAAAPGKGGRGLSKKKKGRHPPPFPEALSLGDPPADAGLSANRLPPRPAERPNKCLRLNYFVKDEK